MTEWHHRVSFITSHYTHVFDLPSEQSISYTAGGMEWLNTELCMAAKDVEELKSNLKWEYWGLGMRIQTGQMEDYEVTWYFLCN